MAKRIPNGASLFIDIGYPRLKYCGSALINHERLRIVTNNINAAHLLRQMKPLILRWRAVPCT